MKSFKLTLAASFWLFNIELKEDLKLYMWFELYFYWKTHLKGRVTENNQIDVYREKEWKT